MRRALRILLIAMPLLAGLALALAMIILPEMVAGRLIEKVHDRYALTLAAAGGAGLSLENGLSVTLDDVTLSDPNESAVPVASVRRVFVEAPLSGLFGGPIGHVRLLSPMFTFEAARSTATADEVKVGGTEDRAATIAKKDKDPAAFTIEIENGSVKAADSTQDISISAADISGDIFLHADGTLDARLRGLVNDTPSRLELAVADVVRLRARGSPADISFTSDNARIELAGLLATAARLTFDGRISAEAKDAGHFLKWLGLTLDGMAKPTPLAFDAGLSLSGASASLTDLAFALGDMKGKGKLSMQAASPRPQVKAELFFSTLNFGIYGKEDGKTSASGISKGWRESPLQLSDLNRIDAIVTLTSDAITSEALATGPATLTAVLSDGRLKANIATRQFHGGTGQVTIELQGSTPARLGLDIDVADAEAKDFLGRAFGITFLSGPASFAAKLTATGNSQAELISTLAGSSQLSLKPARLDGLNIVELAGTIAKQDATGWGLASGKATLLASAEVNAELADGIATLKEGSRLEVEGLSLALGGTVDLLRQALGLEVKPDKQTGLALPVAVHISGPWGEPKLSARIDSEGVNDLADEAAEQAKKTFNKLFGN